MKREGEAPERGRGVEKGHGRVRKGLKGGDGKGSKHGDREKHHQKLYIRMV